MVLHLPHRGRSPTSTSARSTPSWPSAIAVFKATLVVLFFMHVRYSTRLTILTAVAGFFWLAIFIGMTLMDYLSRGQIPAHPWQVEAWEVEKHLASSPTHWYNPTHNKGGT